MRYRNRIQLRPSHSQNPPNSLWFAFPWVLFHRPHIVEGTRALGFLELHTPIVSDCCRDIGTQQRTKCASRFPTPPTVRLGTVTGFWAVTCGLTLTTFWTAFLWQRPGRHQVLNGIGQDDPRQPITWCFARLWAGSNEFIGMMSSVNREHYLNVSN